MKAAEEEFRVLRLGSGDVQLMQKLVQLFHIVFETGNANVAGTSHLEKLLSNPVFIALALVRGNEIAGGLTAYELPAYYSASPEIYIYDIAVHPQFQRKGLGEKLLSALEDHCRRNGIATMFVEAHEEDAHAIDFYRATGGKAEKVVHFNYFLADAEEK